MSSDSHGSTTNEWLKSNTEEWTPPRQPSRPTTSRNVINLSHGSAMTAAILPDSTSSSGEEQPSSSSEQKAPEFEPYQVLPYEPPQKDKGTTTTNTTTTTSTATNTGSSGESGSELNVQPQEFSQTINKETITTGSAYR